MKPEILTHLTHAFWRACRSGHRKTAEYLLEHGAAINWIGWDRLTPLDPRKSGSTDLISWLEGRGAASSAGGSLH